MANNAKVMGSIKDFLLKLKACDSDIPEELAEDALEMVEGVKDGLCNDEEAEVEVKEDVEDEDPKEEEEALTKDDVNKVVEDSMIRVLRNYGLIKDSAMESLDELEENLGEEEVEDEMNEEEVTVDPEKMNDSLRRELLRAVKPVIANVKDSRQRKILSDSFAKALKMNKTSNGYSDAFNFAKSNAKDSMMEVKTKDSDYDFGKEIAKKYNPHYKED